MQNTKPPLLIELAFFGLLIDHTINDKIIQHEEIYAEILLVNFSITKNKSFRLLCFGLLLVPHSSSLHAVDWPAILSRNKIWHRFSSQPKNVQCYITLISAVAVAYAAYLAYVVYDFYYRSQPPRLQPIGNPINICSWEVPQSNDYTIYTFGSPETEHLMSEDIHDLLLILSKERDKAVCSDVDFALMFQHDARLKVHFTQEQIRECASSKNLHVSIDFPWYLWGFKKPLMWKGTDVYIMRNAQQQFVGFVMSGREPRANDRNFALFVKPDFRNNGCAKRLVQYTAKKLVEQGETTINFFVVKDNPICAWYDRFGFTRAEAKPRGAPTEGYEYAGLITCNNNIGN